MTRTEELIQSAQAGDKAAAETLIQENKGLIWSVARRFLGRGTESDDLYQLGCLGFLKAVDGFDPANVDFFDAETRNVLELFMAVKAGKKSLPSELTLVAQGCRPIVASRAVAQGNLNYAKGAHRVMRVNVWSL